MKRPLCIATVFYILGIVMGLYLEMSIAFLLVFLIFIIFIFNIVVINKQRKTKKYLQENSNYQNKEEDEKNNIKYKGNLKSKNSALIKIKDMKQIKVKEKIGFILKFVLLLLILMIGIINVKQIDNKYEKFYNKIQHKEGIEIEAIVMSSSKEKDYSYTYEIQILSINENEKYRGFKLILNVRKNEQKENNILQYGDYIFTKGEFSIPDTARNYGGFDYQEYLKSKKIYGTIYVKENIKVLNTKKYITLGSGTHYIQNSIKNNMGKILPKETSNLCVGILIGIREDLSEKVEQNFKDSNLTHMLAVSGSHITYIILGITTLLSKTDRRFSKIITILFLIFFMALTGCTASVVRACIMGIIILISKLVYRKSDIWTNLALSSLIILIINPYVILDMGFQLSYGGTIGIVLLSKRMSKFIKQKLSIKYGTENQEVHIKDYEGNKETYIKTNSENKKNNINNKLNKIINYIIDTVVVTFSANVIIIPIMAFQFNTISLAFWISNLLVSPFMGTVVILGFIVYLLSLISISISKIIAIPLNIFLTIFLKIAEACSKIPFSSIIVKTPYMISIVIYYLIIILFLNRRIIVKKVYKIKSKLNLKERKKLKNKIKREQTNYIVIKNNKTQLRNVRTKIKNKQLKYKEQKIIFKYIICCIIIVFLVLGIFINSADKKLRIYFIDVGQGDSTLIITQKNKTILIDGGGSELGNFSVGEKTLLPYLLDRRIKTLDYVMISHFDTDHVRRTFICNGKNKSKKCYYMQTRGKFSKL